MSTTAVTGAKRNTVKCGFDVEKNQKKCESAGEIEQLGKLTGELAHEIKNPLSTIKVNLQLIREELQQPGRNESATQSGEQACKRALRKIGVIEKEADRLEKILDGFLRYLARPELQLASVDVNSLISDMVDFYSPQAHSHSIIIRQHINEKPLICKIDAAVLKQAILNLFLNAQQAMGDGGDLMVRTLRDGENAVIRISDTGCGISTDKLDRIFDVYYSSRPHGSGLGLPTAKKIIEAHNGTITVDSEPGKGTSFSIKLPLQTQ